jgi:hypothetical protein
MSQSRTMSLVESIANVLAGFGVAVATQIAIFPLFGLRTTLAENLRWAPSSQLCRSPGRTACEGCSRGFGSVPNAAAPPDSDVSAAL